MKRPRERFYVTILIVLSFSFGSIFIGHSSNAPTRNTLCETGGCAVSSGGCTDDIFLDGTTPVDHPTNGGASTVGTAGQDFGGFLNGRMGSGKKLCLEPQTFTATTCLTFTNSNMILDGNGAVITMTQPTNGIANLICANPVLANSYTNLTVLNTNFYETYTTPCSCISIAFTGNYHNTLWYNDNFTANNANVVYSSTVNVQSLTKTNVDSELYFIKDNFKLTNPAPANAGNVVTALARNEEFLNDVFQIPGGGGGGLILYGLGRQGIDGPMSVLESRFNCISNGVNNNFNCAPLIVEQIYGAIVEANSFNTTGIGVTIQQNADYAANAGPNYEVTVTNNVFDLWCTATLSPAGFQVSAPISASNFNNLIRGTITGNQFIIQNQATCSGVFPCLNFNGGGTSDITASDNVCQGFSNALQFGGTLADKNVTITANSFRFSSNSVLDNTAFPSNVIVADNIFPSGLGMGTPTVSNAWSGFTFRNNANLNPIGKIASPFNGVVVGLVGSSGASATPTQNTVYKVTGCDIYVSASGGTQSITIFDQNGSSNPLISGLTSLTNTFIPVGYSIQWITISGGPTITVSGG